VDNDIKVVGMGDYELGEKEDSYRGTVNGFSRYCFGFYERY